MRSVNRWFLLFFAVAVAVLALLWSVSHGWLFAPPEEPEGTFDEDVLVTVRRGCMDASYNIDLAAWRESLEGRASARRDPVTSRPGGGK